MTLSLPAPDGPRENPQDRADSGSPGADARHNDGDDAPSSGESRAKTRQHRSARSTEIPSVEEILASIQHLNGAVVLGLIKPALANVVQRGLRTMLDFRIKQQTAQTSDASLENLAALYRADPSVMDLIAPLLTSDQVEWLLRHEEAPSE